MKPWEWSASYGAESADDDDVDRTARLSGGGSDGGYVLTPRVRPELRRRPFVTRVYFGNKRAATPVIVVPSPVSE